VTRAIEHRMVQREPDHAGSEKPGLDRRLPKFGIVRGWKVLDDLDVNPIWMLNPDPVERDRIQSSSAVFRLADRLWLELQPIGLLAAAEPTEWSLTRNSCSQCESLKSSRTRD
jgi:hypothetical protein